MTRLLVLTLLTVAIYYMVEDQVRRWRQRLGDRLRRHLANQAKKRDGGVVRTVGSLVACDRCGLYVAEPSIVRDARGRGHYCSETCAFSEASGSTEG